MSRSQPLLRRPARVKLWWNPAVNAVGRDATASAVAGERGSWLAGERGSWLPLDAHMPRPHPSPCAGILQDLPHPTRPGSGVYRTPTASSKFAAGVAIVGARRLACPSPSHRSLRGCVSTASRVHTSRRNAASPRAATTAGVRATTPPAAHGRSAGLQLLLRNAPGRRSMGAVVGSRRDALRRADAHGFRRTTGLRGPFPRVGPRPLLAIARRRRRRRHHPPWGKQLMCCILGRLRTPSTFGCGRRPLLAGPS